MIPDRAFFNWEEWEIVPEPAPAHETPRAMLLRETGYDFESADFLTWEMLREDPRLQQFVTGLLMRHAKPRLLLRRKGEA